jgi:hypothetical protein
MWPLRSSPPARLWTNSTAAFDVLLRRSTPREISEIVSVLAYLIFSCVRKPMAITGEEFEIEGPNGAHNVVVVMDLWGLAEGGNAVSRALYFARRGWATGAKGAGLSLLYGTYSWWYVRISELS